jgi:hypothetical protein
MKTRSTRSLRRLLLKITYFGGYADQIHQMEKALAKKPEKLQIDIIGSGELSADIALLIRSVLLERTPRTHLITNARSSLQGGAVLIWLQGDTRLIREDAKLYFRRPSQLDADEEGDQWKEEDSTETEIDLDEVDYAQVLNHIDNFLPVKELAGRPLNVEILREFGLVDNEKVDSFLASSFASSNSAESSNPGLEDKREKPPSSEVPQSNRRSE